MDVILAALMLCLFVDVESTGHSTATPPRDLKTDTVPRTSVKSKTCLFDLGNCLNGYCVTSPIGEHVCICSEGWTGILCNQACPMPCVHGVCRVYSDQQYCNCYNQSVSGEFCHQVKPSLDTSISNNNADKLTQIETATSQYIATHTVQRTSTKDVCLYGLAKCVHGHCVTTPNGGQMCNCYTGWAGFVCNKACRLPCVHGVCSIYSTEKRFCNCYNGSVTGELCDKLVPERDSIIIKHTLQVEQIEKASGSLTYIVIAVVAAILIMLAMVCTTCYLMWKRRAPVLIKDVYQTHKPQDDDTSPIRGTV